MDTDRLIRTLAADNAHRERPVALVLAMALLVAAHLEALPARQRDVLRSIAVDSASIKATAAKLSMTEGAVRVALHRGLANLTAKLRKA